MRVFICMFASDRIAKESKSCYVTQFCLCKKSYSHGCVPQFVFVNRGKRMCIVGMTTALEYTTSVPRFDLWFDIKRAHLDLCLCSQFDFVYKTIVILHTYFKLNKFILSNIKLHQQRWLCHRWYWQWKLCQVRSIPAIAVQPDNTHQAKGERSKVQKVQVQVQEAIERHCYFPISQYRDGPNQGTSPRCGAQKDQESTARQGRGGARKGGGTGWERLLEGTVAASIGAAEGEIGLFQQQVSCNCPLEEA